MSSKKPEKEKERLHPRNKNREKYDLNALTTAIPALKITLNPANQEQLQLISQALML